MKKILSILTIMALPLVSYSAPVRVELGGTGKATFPVGSILTGNGVAPLVPVSDITIGKLTATDTSATSNILGNLNVLGVFTSASFAPTTFTTNSATATKMNISSGGLLVGSQTVDTTSTAKITDTRGVNTALSLISNATTESSVLNFFNSAYSLATSSWAIIKLGTSDSLSPSGFSIGNYAGGIFKRLLTITSSGLVGIGSTTPSAILSVQAPLSLFGTTTNILTVSTTTTAGGNTLPVFSIDHKGHIITGGGSPVASACGTGGASFGNDQAMSVFVGTGATTNCTITFSKQWTVVPTCIVTPRTENGNFLTYSYTATAITLTRNSISSNVFDILCIGN